MVESGSSSPGSRATSTTIAFVFSMKSRNPKVMINAYRLCVARLRELDAEVGGQKSEVSGETTGVFDFRLPTSDLRSWSYRSISESPRPAKEKTRGSRSAIGMARFCMMNWGHDSRFPTKTASTKSRFAKALADLVGQAHPCRTRTRDKRLRCLQSV